jgi:Dullard-like phosphatase family protein
MAPAKTSSIRRVVVVFVAVLLLLLLGWWIVCPGPQYPMAPPAAHPGAAHPGAAHPTKRVLVLDLDETLVHSDLGPSMNVASMTVHLRPGVHAFLASVRALYDEVVLFTAGTQPYADAVIDTYLDPDGRIFGRRFYRDSCRPMTAEEARRLGPPTLVKDLRLIGEPMSRVVILDNTPSAYALQPSNGVPIASYLGPHATGDIDDALERVLPVLECIARRMRETELDWRHGNCA